MSLLIITHACSMSEILIYNDAILPSQFGTDSTHGFLVQALRVLREHVSAPGLNFKRQMAPRSGTNSRLMAWCSN